MRGLHENDDIDDLCHKFYKEFHLDKKGFTFGSGELSVCMIDHDGSDDDVKMPIESDALLKDFFMHLTMRNTTKTNMVLARAKHVLCW